jgi:putative tricarboxylic transport membrane protein
LKIVVYSNGGAGITAALGGHIDAWAGSLAGTIPLAQIGKVNVMGVSAANRQPGRAVALPTFREQGIDAVYAGYRGSVGPGGLSLAQRAYWEATFSKIVSTPEWKAAALEYAWEPDYKNSSEARQYLATAYDNLRKRLGKLGVTRPTQ